MAHQVEVTEETLCIQARDKEKALHSADRRSRVVCFRSCVGDQCTSAS